MDAKKFDSSTGLQLLVGIDMKDFDLWYINLQKDVNLAEREYNNYIKYRNFKLEVQSLYDEFMEDDCISTSEFLDDLETIISEYN